jgi:putative nucleotidyltransferase with HDIG domain
MGKTDMAPTQTQSAADWIVDVGALVSPPDICIRIFELMEDEGVSAQDLGDVISRDPSLTARLLRIVNSPFYGFSRRIDTVTRAITVIGSSELYNLVVAASATTSFSRIPNFIVNIDTFWRHGVCCGIIARELARHCRVLHPERLFVAGLLHDIGSLIIYHREPEAIRDLLIAAQGDETTLSRRERMLFGFDHAELGSLLLDQWHLPPNLVTAVRHHHEPAGADETAQLEASILHIADAIANHSEQGAFYAAPSAQLLSDGTAWGLLGIEPEAGFLNSMMERTREQYRVAVDLFG